jgi:membrane associated rhomboid family serine protease
MGFLPLGDDNSRVRTTPWLVWTIIAINAGVWLLQLLWGERFTNGWSVVPYELSHNVDVTKASDSALQVLVVGGKAHHISQYPGPVPIQLTLLSSMFMHGSWMHIIGNMLYLWIFGDQIEDLLSHGKFIAFYLLCGLFAGVAQVVMDPQSILPCVGASGAIAGVLGAYLMKFPGNTVRVLVGIWLVPLPAILVLGGWIALQVVEQMNSLAGPNTGGVAYAAHIGGFVAGALLVFLFSGQRRTSAP